MTLTRLCPLCHAEHVEFNDDAMCPWCWDEISDGISMRSIPTRQWLDALTQEPKDNDTHQTAF